MRRTRARGWLLVVALSAAGCSDQATSATTATTATTGPVSSGGLPSSSSAASTSTVPASVAGSTSTTQAFTGAAQRYDFGAPSPEEQQLWFLANRARADPAAEGHRLAEPDEQLVRDGLVAFGVDTAQLMTDFDGYPARPPLAWTEGLASAAARHAADQAAARTQEHRGSDGSKPGARVRAAGVAFTVLHENISGYAHSPEFAHDAFLIDWGGDPPTGVQEWPTPGHRFALLSAGADATSTNTVGMSWVPVEAGSDNYGPFVVVQEFARVDGIFVVGAVWADVDGDGTLDWGEGVADVEVRVDEGQWFAITLSGGVYELPVDSGTHTLTFRAPDGRSTEQIVQVGADNVLVNAQLS